MPIRIITIVGARPQFVKAAMITRAISKLNVTAGRTIIEEKILHSGQHYDENMSKVFFTQLNIPRPNWILEGMNQNVNNLKEMILPILAEEKPDYVLLFGDTNTTLAGALAAEAARMKIIHIEAGLRSFNNTMPEEYNRIETDKRSSLLFCPTTTAVNNLHNEAIKGKTFLTGDVMYDAAMTFSAMADKNCDIIQKLEVTPKKFNLLTVHRAESTDKINNLKEIVFGINDISTPSVPTVWPIHPRTSAVVAQHAELQNILSQNRNIKIVPPITFLEMIMLEKNAYKILTDSGGIQKEAYFHKTPCITLRNETEWTETIDAGWNQLSGYSRENIVRCYNTSLPTHTITEYGHGDAADKIIELICKNC